MTKAKKLTKPIFMGCANDRALKVTHLGEVKMVNPHNDNLKLKKVHYAKQCPANLLSERRLRHSIIFVTISDEKHLIDRSTGRIIHTAKQDGRFWIVRMIKYDNNRLNKTNNKFSHNNKNNKIDFEHKIVSTLINNDVDNTKRKNETSP